MSKKEYLNEENYQNTKKKVSKVALIVLIIGFLIGGFLIALGIINHSKINSRYSVENKAAALEKLEGEKQIFIEDLSVEKQKIINSKTEIENKIKPIEDQIKSLERVAFNGFDDDYYARKDKIEELEKSIENDKNSIKVIDDVLDESFEHCNFNEAKNNTYTSKYCSIKAQIKTKNAEIANLDTEFSDFNKSFDTNKYIPFYIIGGFIIIVSCMISGSIFMITKRREMLAFSAQQIMPIAQEGIDKMAPTIGKATAKIAKETVPVYKDIAKEMAPIYKDIAKEISKGIKEGLNDPDNKKNDENL